MGEIIRNPDGTYTMKGFSTNNKEDMKAIGSLIKDKVLEGKPKK